MKWEESLTAEYAMNQPDYVQSLQSPMRRKYPTARMKTDELLTKLSKVKRRYSYLFTSLNFQDNLEYDAFGEDIAVVNIFAGQSTDLGRVNLMRLNNITLKVI